MAAARISLVSSRHDGGSGQGKRRLVVLGSTGSIGVNTLQVVAHLNATTGNGHAGFEVVGLAAGRKIDALAEQANRFSVPAVAIAEPAEAAALRRVSSEAQDFSGPDAALELMEHADATDVVAAVVGKRRACWPLAAARKGMTIGLANKETLVAAGALVAPLVRKHGGQIIPIDSEHSAIFQCLANRARDGLEHQDRK